MLEWTRTNCSTSGLLFSHNVGIFRDPSVHKLRPRHDPAQRISPLHQPCRFQPSQQPRTRAVRVFAVQFPRGPGFLLTRPPERFAVGSLSCVSGLVNDDAAQFIKVALRLGVLYGSPCFGMRFGFFGFQ